MTIGPALVLKVVPFSELKSPSHLHILGLIKLDSQADELQATSSCSTLGFS